MQTIHIIEGPVGAGKTTYAIELGRKIGTPPLVLDKWMVNMFLADRPEGEIWDWYAERKARCIHQIMEIARGLVDSENDAVVELGLIKVEDRLQLYADLEAKDQTYMVHVLEAPRVERKRRVAKRNAEQGETFAMHVSDEIFEIASDMWEPIGKTEQRGRSGRFFQAN